MNNENTIVVGSATDTQEQIDAVNGTVATSDVKKTNDSQSVSGSKSEENKKEASDASKKVESKETKSEDEIDSDDPEMNDDDENASDEKDDEHKPKKKLGGFKKRIGKLASERDFWKEQYLAEKESKTNVKPDSKNVETPTAQAVEATNKPKPENFDSHEEYTEALTDWKLDQREQAKTQKEKEDKFKEEFSKRQQTFQKRYNEFNEKTPDFEEAMESVSDIMLPMAQQDAIVSSEHAPAIMYELAKDRKNLERIAALDTLAAIREIGKIEAKIEARSMNNKNETNETKTTKAPPPIKPLNGNNSTNKSVYDQNLSQSDYEKMRMEQIRKKQF